MKALAGIFTLLAVIQTVLAAPKCNPVAAKPINVQWFAGKADCTDFGGNYSQVYQYDANTYFIRHNKCVNWQAPFQYLLFGQKKALLIDAGPSDVNDMRGTVEDIIAEWLKKQGRSRSSLHLVVAHSCGNWDNAEGDDQFWDQKYTDVVGADQASIIQFFGLYEWPNQEVEYELGNRTIGLLPVPGHDNNDLAFYDCGTNILFTGKTLSPGWIDVWLWPDYYDSVNRLAKYVAGLPTPAYIIGSHIDMTDQPGIVYPKGEQYTPHEHVLPLSIKDLTELQAAMNRIGRDNATREVHSNFVINPMAVPLQDGGRVGEHGMVMIAAPDDFPRSGLFEATFTHIPMFRQPHDFQFAFDAWVDRENLPAELPEGEITIVPTPFSLNDLMQQNILTIHADMYQGSAEHGGPKIGSTIIYPKNDEDEGIFQHQLDPNAPMPLSNLRYYQAYPCPEVPDGYNCTIVHHIEQKPDFEHITTIVVNAEDCQDRNGQLITHEQLRAHLNTKRKVDNVADKSQQKRSSIRNLKDVDMLNTEWVFYGRPNSVAGKLKEGETVMGFELNSEQGMSCKLPIGPTISCLLGPDFDDQC